MKRFLGLVIIFGSVSFFALTSIYAAVDTDKVFNDIKGDLQNKGIEAGEIDGVRKPVVEMLEKGAAKDEIENSLLDLSKNGVKGKELRESVNSMDDLVKGGKSPREAGNVVSRAVHQAQAEGLRGTALADKVHEAIKKMQTEKRESIETKEERKETENVGTKMEEGSRKGNFPSGAHGGGMGHMGQGHGHNR
ncbi:MAG: hypothetical protein PHG87_05185 [Candidatus Omnitrophica bacterium]|nr:hypothetical protein [Candidatus Omnitrophota bacterium]